MRPKIKLQPTIKQILFILLFIAGGVKLNFVSGVVREKWPIQ